jgi:hypothetical protein
MGVYGVAANQSSMYLAFGAAPWSSTRGIQILSNGNVGIGTATPAEKLDVAGNIKTTGQHIIENGAPTIYMKDTAGRASMLHTNSNNFYILGSSATDPMN